MATTLRPSVGLSVVVVYDCLKLNNWKLPTMKISTSTENINVVHNDTFLNDEAVELSEVTSSIGKTVTQVSDCLEGIESVEEINTFLKSKVEQGKGINQETAVMMEAAVNSLRKRFGVGHQEYKTPAIEGPFEPLDKKTLDVVLKTTRNACRHGTKLRDIINSNKGSLERLLKEADRASKPGHADNQTVDKASVNLFINFTTSFISSQSFMVNYHWLSIKHSLELLEQNIKCYE